MEPENREVVDVHCNPHSLPSSPSTKVDKSSMSKTPIPNESVQWKQGIPMPIQDSTSPNQQALHLITGFAMGEIQMKGDEVQYTSQTINKSITESLQELPWGAKGPSKKRKVDRTTNHKALIAKKEPKTKAKLLAEKYSRTMVPDAEIRPENIIVGSPMYIPYKKIMKNQKGQGKFGKKLTFPMSSSSDMPRRINQIVIGT